MQLKKLIFTTLALLFIIGTGFSQSAKVIEKAAEKVEELNKEIVSVNPDLALTAEQKETLTELYAGHLKGARKMKKENSSKEEITAFRKENWQQIKAVLTKEQLKSRKEAKSRKSND